MPSGFSVIKESSISLARRGIYSFTSGARAIETPAFIVPSSRGVIPHLTPDNVDKRREDVAGLYVAAEDWLEKLPEEPPIYKYPGCGRDLLCLPSDVPLFISIRRSTPVQLPRSNGDKYYSVMTSEGALELQLSEYYKFVGKMQPDVVLAAPDLPSFSLQQRQEQYEMKNKRSALRKAGNFKDDKGDSETEEDGKNSRVRTKPFVKTATPKLNEDLSTGLIPQPGGNRVKKMVQRTQKWMTDMVSQSHTAHSSLFAPILPYVDLRTQDPYLQYVQSLHVQNRLGGISLWSYFGNKLERERDENAATKFDDNLWDNVVNNLKERGLDQLIRYQNATMETPQDILDMIAKTGADLFNGDLVSQYTDAGVVLDFVFPVQEAESAEQEPIGMNMWDVKYTADMSRLGHYTPNVTGTHNRAYIHHLLNAHEMTAWVILQMHNLHVLDLFFQGIRKTLSESAGEPGLFEKEVEKFKHRYGGRDEALKVKEYEGKIGVAQVVGGRFSNDDVSDTKEHAGDDRNSDKKSRYPKARAYAIDYEELNERTRGMNFGKKLNETRWSKELD